MSIGTGDGSEDFFPRTVVGGKNTTKIAIVDGFVQRDEAPAGISVGDYTKRNFSSSDVPDPSANEFRMEPGRCLWQQLIGVSKAHVPTTLSLKPTCIKRKKSLSFAPCQSVGLGSLCLCLSVCLCLSLSMYYYY